jgi:hypothetical protein
VAGSCEDGDEPSGSGPTELVSQEIGERSLLSDDLSCHSLSNPNSSSDWKNSLNNLFKRKERTDFYVVYTVGKQNAFFSFRMTHHASHFQVQTL